ncbi:MAG: NAD-glutamate dehydrogenase [Gammaproteobacteria bacterium]|uniref:NAD-glutamate dehydrogenase domain-containing protein n=1 Tax=Methylotuvimicrobium sp. TaxID=2822413 RepID=UPI001D528704|nr:NAD-glutamate dehydrogenase [Gammaproteobacteria bacterium]
MKVYLRAGNLALKASRQRRKLKAVQHILEGQGDNQNRRFLIKLAEMLLFPDSYFVSLPPNISSSLIVRIFELFTDNIETHNVKELRIPNDPQQFIVIVCRNLTHVVDSLLALQSDQQLPFQLLAHPVLTVKRQGEMITGLESNGLSGTKQLLIVLRLEAVDPGIKNAFFERITAIIEWAEVLDRDRIALKESLLGLNDISEFSQFSALIDWLEQKAFIPFKSHRLSVDDQDAFTSLKALGSEFCHDNNPTALSNFLRVMQAVLARDYPLIIQYLPIRSPLIHDQPLIYIGFKHSLPDGGGFCEYGFFGVFDETEMGGACSNIPFLQRKIEQTLAHHKTPENSYEYLQLKEIFNLFPKVDLFLLEIPQLDLLIQSLRRYLYRPEGIKLVVLGGFGLESLSALIIAPVHLYSEEIESVLLGRLSSSLDSSAELVRKIVLSGPYLGLHFLLRPTSETITIDVDQLDRDLNKQIRPWSTSLCRTLERAYGKYKACKLWQKYRTVFPPGYQALMPPRHAIKDIGLIESLLNDDPMTIGLLRPYGQIRHYRLHFCSRQERYLDEYIPILENFNLRVLDQVQFPLTVSGSPVFIKSFTISAAKSQHDSFTELKSRLLSGIGAVFNGKAENDQLNSLLVLAGMTWQQIDVLRAYRNYYLQLGYPTTTSSFNQALLANSSTAFALFEYFEARFRPDPNLGEPMQREEQLLFPLRLKLLENLSGVTDINHDKILRTLFNLIDATMRCNFHVRQKRDDFFIAFKINSLGIIDMPPPKPQNEIYVHAVDMEGIHLRGGKISRGGIRWSDRPDDFRTEILDLMQTQMSKNALIIPKGAKGGFIVKTPVTDPDFKEVGRKAYVKLIQGLLDLTDNYVEDRVVRLPGIVSYDDHDPYLVVAADKGTAQFSDLANSVSAQYHFWLGDAFASGGSNGYNHKALGITARGAWECVKRHFRELGKDIQSEPFTVVGIGSMDGDVFGNGMLLSNSTHLLAAISGRHIFIDPAPADLEKSYLERKRLFELPGSSWDDYDRSLISEGGGVYSRHAKDIVVSPQLRKWLGIRYKSLDGSTLIRLLLTAPVELLWFGGIGTYVKATNEKHEDVGDRSNDDVRVDALQLRAAVVGEGANLGFTQKARIEFALGGGRIDTDAVHNSGGVDCSDHEVNLKILLTGLQKKQGLKDYRQTFESLTDEVCAAVLTNNYKQSLCLSLEQLRVKGNAEQYLLLSERLESAGVLDRSVESFPSYKAVMGRSGQIITRPEFAVLMAACKIQLTQDIMDRSELISVSDYDIYLQSYFPDPIRQNFAEHLTSHPLAPAIKATVISNTIINQAGCSFLNWHNDNGGSIIDSITVYLTFDQVLEAEDFRREVFSLDNLIPAEQQYGLLLQLENVLAEFSQWVLMNELVVRPDSLTLENYRSCLTAFANEFISPDSENEAVNGIPVKLAKRIAFINSLNDFPQIALLSTESGHSFSTVRKTFIDVAKFLDLDKLLDQLTVITVQNHWERKVFNNLKAEIKQTQGRLVQSLLASDAYDCKAYFAGSSNKQKLIRYQRVFQEVSRSATNSLMPYLTLNKALMNLI